MQQTAGLSPLTELRTAPHTGRGIYAKAHIPRGTLLLTSADLAAFVIYAEYRKEVCAQCLAYDRGRNWKIRPEHLNLAFCSAECHGAWRDGLAPSGNVQLDHRRRLRRVRAFEGADASVSGPTAALTADVFIESYRAVEKLSRNGASFAEDGEGDFTIKPTDAEVSRTWSDPAIEDALDGYKRVRGLSRRGDAHTPASGGRQMSKVLRQRLDAVTSLAMDRNVISYQLSGLLCSILQPKLWEDVLKLEDAEQPFQFRAELQRSVRGVMGLVAVLPGQVLLACGEQVGAKEMSVEGAGTARVDDACDERSGAEDVTGSTGGGDGVKRRLWELVARSSHNSFNIWSLDATEQTTDGSDGFDTPPTAGGPSGSECLGYGTWPSASYWNHSCAPNLVKKRSGRSWRFWTNRDVGESEELCISYLGGDEATLDVQQRRDRLRKVWGFDCECTRCHVESRAQRGP